MTSRGLEEFNNSFTGRAVIVQLVFPGVHWFRVLGGHRLPPVYRICNPPPPPPVPARKTQCSGATFRRAVFSAKEVPGAQDLSPRAQTHLPFGCSVVGVMWKPKASLNLQKKISSLGLYMVPGQQYVRTCHWSSGYALVYRSASVGLIPSTGLPKFFALFVT